MRQSNFYGNGVGLHPPRSIHIASLATGQKFLPPFTSRCQKESASNDDRRDASSQRGDSSARSALSRPKYRRPSTPAAIETTTKGDATTPAKFTERTPSPPTSERRPSFTSGSSSSGRYRNQNYYQNGNNNSNNFTSSKQSTQGGSSYSGHASGRSNSSNSSSSTSNMNTNTSGSYRVPPVRRWMSDLAKQLKDVLEKDYDYTNTSIDPQISAKILSLMPEAIPSAGERRQERTADGAVKASSSGVLIAADESVTGSGSDLPVAEGGEIEIENVVEEEEEEDTVPSIYDSELAAILSHYKTNQVVEPEQNEKKITVRSDQQGEDEKEKGSKIMQDDPMSTESVYSKAQEQDNGNIPIELSSSTEHHFSSFSTSGNPNWRPKIGEGSLMILIRIIADSTPMAALQLYRILDAAYYPTRTPRALGNMVGLLVKKNCPEAAAAVLKDAILSDKKRTGTSSSSSSSTESTSYTNSLYTRGSTGGGKYVGTGPGKFSDAWASLSRSGRPEIVQSLIQELAKAGIPADTDTYVCSIRAYARAKNTAAAVACFEEMQRKGIDRTSAVFAALARAAADGGDVHLAMKVLYWAERDAEKNPSLKMTPVWRELFLLSCNDDAAPGLRTKLVDRLEKQGRHVTCDLFNKVVVPAADAGHITGAIDLFTKLRSKGLISGLPVENPRGATAGGSGGPIELLNIAGRDYEQVVLEPPTTSNSTINSASRNSKNKYINSATPAATTATVTAATTSLTESEIDSDEEETLDISGYSDAEDTESEGEEEEIGIEEGEEQEPILANTMTNTTSTNRNSGSTTSSPSGSRIRSSRGNKRNSIGPSSPAAAQFLYTSLILGAHKARLDEPMKQLYSWLHEDGLLPNRPILTRMVACLPYANDPAGALELYEYIRKLKIPMDGFMYGHIIAALLGGPQGRERWETVLLLTHRMHINVSSSHDTSVQTSMVVNAGKNGWAPELLALYRLMLQDGVMPRPITWNAFITAAMRCNRPDLGFAFGVAMRKMGCSMDAATHSALFSCAAAQGDAAAAQKQWHAMLEDKIAPDCIACSSYMWACLAGGKANIAIEFFESWRKEKKPPGWHDTLTSGRAAAAGGGSVTTSAAPTFSEVCTALMKGGRWDQSRTALQLQRWIKGQGEDPRSINLDQLRNKASSRGGRWAQASALADEAVKTPTPVNPPEPDSVSISFAVTGYAQMGDTVKALQLADELSSMDIPLHSVAFSTALDGCAAAGALDAALKLLRRARAAGLRPDQAAYGAAISAAAPQGNVPAALMVLDWMVEDGALPNIISANSALAVCASAVDADAALDVFWKMKSHWGIEPDPIAYATLCEALAKAGRWGDAVRAMLISETASYRNYNQMQVSNGMCLLKLFDTDPPKINIDLHGLSVAAASAAVRAWLLVLCQSPAIAAGKIDDQQVTIVTGRGRNSIEGVSRLKPGIELLIKKGLGGDSTAADGGQNLNFTTPPENQGMLTISGRDLRAGLEDPDLDLGFGSKEEEEKILKLLTGKVVPTPDVLPKPAPKRKE